MKTYLVTGAAGFIGANYIKYILAKHSDVKVVILDALTYAGNLGTIAKDIDNERCFFIKGDICSREVVDGLFAEYRFDYVVNFAAESHVDRSIENPQLFLITNILGTQNLLDCARRAWVMGKDEQGYPTWRKGVRYHQVSTDEVYGSLGAEGFFTEATPLCLEDEALHPCTDAGGIGVEPLLDVVGAQHNDEQVDGLVALEKRIGHAQSVHRLMDGVHENRRPARKALFRHKILAAQRRLQPTGPALILVEADAVVGAVCRVGAIAVSVGVSQTKDMLFHRSIPLFSFRPGTGGSSRLRPPCRRRCEAGRRGSPVPLQRRA